LGANMKILRSALLGAAAAAAISAPAGAVTIVLHDIGGVTGTAAELGFSVAARYWESVLTNNATIELNVGYGGLPPGVLGSTGASLAQFVPIDTYYSLLNANKTSALDNLAMANLSPLNANGGVSV